ncbi:MAG: HAD-IA family hydrolase [Clostridia bacterium]|nr:HAD-IA family hydrolase [Clostridia bacterium]
MKKYEVIAFDLDGTLTNPERGQLTGFEYALKKHSITYPSREWLKRYIGPPIHDVWQLDFNLSFEKVVEMIETYREYYNVYGWRENDIYPDIHEMLSELKARGYKLAVATGKPEKIAKRILRLFALDSYFDFIGGASEDDSRHRKSDILRYVLEGVGESSDKTVLVGDRRFDAEGARALGADCIGVLWGHGSKDELSAAGFDYIAESPSDVTEYLTKRAD